MMRKFTFQFYGFLAIIQAVEIMSEITDYFRISLVLSL
jgi:hypothetical protein